jgi:CubicO group peptidase (beta-lactamase class C family)
MDERRTLVSRIAAAFAVAATGASFAGCTLVKTLAHNFPDLDDHRIFDSRTIARAESSSPLRGLVRVPRFLTELQVPGRNGGATRLGEYLDQTRTVAFVVMHDDRVVFERYAPGHDARSLLNSFSIAKPMVGALIGIALAEGKIASLDDTVARFGCLYLHHGRWNGAQIVPAEWAARPAPTAAGDLQHRLWWWPAGDEGDFYAYGHNGQFLYVNPRARTVIVKFSESRHQDPVPVFRAIARALQRPENLAELDRLSGQPHALHSPTERRTP